MRLSTAVFVQSHFPDSSRSAHPDSRTAHDAGMPFTDVSGRQGSDGEAERASRGKFVPNHSIQSAIQDPDDEG
ncbi:MAG: hypothetical protein ACU841_12635 [Gammaproteobacteria bacterium]